MVRLHRAESVLENMIELFECSSLRRIDDFRTVSENTIDRRSREWSESGHRCDP